MFSKKIFILLILSSILPSTVFACGRMGTGYEIQASQEKGVFEYDKKPYSPVIAIDSRKYPNIEVYVNGIKIQPDIYDDRRYYSLGEFPSSSEAFFPKNVAVLIKQNNIEIYSAKLKITDTTFSFWELVSPILLAISLFITAFSFILFFINLFIKKFNFVTKILIISMIADAIFFLGFFSSHC